VYCLGSKKSLDELSASLSVLNSFITLRSQHISKPGVIAHDHRALRQALITVAVAAATPVQHQKRKNEKTAKRQNINRSCRVSNNNNMSGSQ